MKHVNNITSTSMRLSDMAKICEFSEMFPASSTAVLLIILQLLNNKSISLNVVYVRSK